MNWIKSLRESTICSRLMMLLLKYHLVYLRLCNAFVQKHKKNKLLKIIKKGEEKKETITVKIDAATFC
jgi:hypothetical protein